MPRPVLRCTFALFAMSIVAACDGPAGSDTLASVAIDPDTAHVTLNTTARLDAVARSEGGRTLPGVTFAWSSSDTSVAKVAADGTVTARRYGMATITASADGVAGSATVWVTGGPGLTLVTEVADTVDAPAAAPLVAELRDAAGLPLAGEPVRFLAVSTGVWTFGAQFENPARNGPVESRTVFTDAQGRASVKVWMGTAAGPAKIIVRHESRALADTTLVTVLPGAAAGVRIAPADTAVFLGRTVQMRASAVDRHGNPTVGAVAYSVVEGPLSVDGSGVVSTPAYGTSQVQARAGGGTATARVASVPVGAFAAARYDQMVVMNMDGTGFRGAGGGISPAWSPDGERLVFTREGLVHVARTASLGTAEPLLKGPTAGWHLWPQYSPDGAWVYYFARVPSVQQAIWRARADGMEEERVAVGPGYPSLSPDGRRMVYFRDGWPPHIHVLELATGRETSLAPGHAPSWSPTGEWIVYNEVDENGYPAGIMVMRPDGSGIRRMTPPDSHYNYSPRWSPDGRWIIAEHDGRAHLIQLETRLLIELPYPIEGSQGVSWKPGALLP